MEWGLEWAKLSEARRAVDTRAKELQTAKEILAEVFGARLGEIDEMILRWMATFCLGE